MVVGGALLGLSAVLAVGVVLVFLVVLAATIVAEVPQVVVEREAVPAEVERGRPAEVRLRFRRRRRRRPRPLHRHRVRRTANRGSPRSARSRRDGSDSISYAVPTGRRGMLTSGPLVVRRFDLFGLVTADRRFGGTCTVRVRPAPLPAADAAVRSPPRPRGSDPRALGGLGVVPPAARVRPRRRHAPHPLAQHGPHRRRSSSSRWSTRRDPSSSSSSTTGRRRSGPTTSSTPSRSPRRSCRRPRTRTSRRCCCSPTGPTTSTPTGSRSPTSTGSPPCSAATSTRSAGSPTCSCRAGAASSSSRASRRVPTC